MSHPNAPRTPADRAQLLIGLAAALPETVEAAMLQCVPRQRTAKQRHTVEQLIAVLYEQFREEHQQAGCPFGPGTTGLARWIFWLAGSPSCWN
jgi:hypothetical protein